MALFRSHKPKMLEAEDKSISLSKDVFNLLLKCETDLSELKSFVNSDKLSMKDAKLAEMENNFLNMRVKIDAIRSEMKIVIDLETQNRDFVGFNDDAYLKDKLNRLDIISSALEELLEIIAEKPAAADMKGLVDKFYEKINLLVDAVNNIINDDKQLENTYSKLQYL
ncbi:MAG: hypothetical protein ACP5N3_04785 [Candidatus Nanoarchaeia archaeon]